MSNLIKEDDLDSFLDSYLKSLILPKIIGLAGPLGAGKTNKAKKIIKFFGCNDIVTSPTFNIVKNYEVGEIKIFHVDLYRLGSWSEFIDLDLPLNEENTFSSETLIDMLKHIEKACEKIFKLQEDVTR